MRALASPGTRIAAALGLALALVGCGSCRETRDAPTDTAAIPDTTAVTDTAAIPDGAPVADTVPTADLPPLSDAWVYATACQVGQERRATSAIALVDAVPAGTIEAPIDLTHFRDGSGRMAIVERAGRIRVAHPDGRVTTALDIRARVYAGFECGLLGLATHPRHVENRRLYTYYCTKRDGRTLSIISEWTMRAGDPDVVDAASERVLIEQPQPWDNHNGGALAFGPDGRLYIAFGDGGSGNDPLNSGQDTQSLLGKILRVDVDVRGGALPYGIPADNPFASAPAAGRVEIYAWGLRNPWRMSFDRLTGELWVGDVGQNAYEEVDVVLRGKNYGWKVMEGRHCRPGGPASCDRDGLELPVLEYGHSLGRSITGGFVYRGTRAPSLVGRYVFADYATRLLFSWARGEPDPDDADDALLTTPGGVVSFGEDEAGELYALVIETGQVLRLEGRLVADGPGAVEPPARLSATGCFTDLATLATPPGVLGYDVALPFWSDGADKRRWVVLPPGGRVSPSGDAEPWRFPVGTVFIKHFELKTSDGPDSPVRRLETRFTIQEEVGVRGFTYRWDAAGDDATLATAGARIPVQSALGTHDWHLPSRGDCATCHRGRGVLGLDSRQLGDAARAWGELGIRTAPTPAVAPHPAPTDSAAPLEARARAWLHVNCAYCHDGLGPSGTPLDLRVTTAAHDMEACDVPPMRGDLGVAGASLIAPGAPERSILWLRTASRGTHGMPPLASALVDPDASVVRDWISALGACP